MDTRDWKRFLLPYENAVEELKVKLKSIRNELVKMGEYSPIEFVTGRVKKVSSILEKAEKLGIEQDNIDKEMEDIAGIRVMCQFVEDIYTVVDYLYDRDGSDLTILNTKDYITNYKDSGYRSYHVIIKYPIQTAFGKKDIIAEIQIRTLSMNFWATIEHSLKYKYEGAIPEHIERRLKKSSDAAFNLDKEMSKIRHEIREAQKNFEIRSNVVFQILENIRKLEEISDSIELDEYRSRFNQMWNKKDTLGLKRLLKEIESKLNETSIN